jgi:putative addiction module component (TIGR02574 family)
MTQNMHKAVNDIKELTQSERNEILKLLIVSIDENHDLDSQKEWANLATKRLNEIESKSVQTVEWDTIKERVLS